MRQARPPHHRRPTLPWTWLVSCCALAGAAAAADTDPRRAINPGLVPNVPSAISRPTNWPTGVAHGLLDGVDKEKHVISSIRRNPGGSLESTGPSQAGHAAQPGTVTQDGRVEQAAYEETAGQPLPVSLETAMIVARVGPEVVLESDLLTPKAIDWLESVSPGLKPEQIRELRLKICQQVIDQHVETLLVYVDACREIPESKLPEIKKNVDKAFDEQMLPRLLKEAEAATAAEYEQKLRAKGQSTDRMRKMFFERGLAQEWLRKNIKDEGEIPHAEMIAWYQNHLAEYDYPARARFEALTIKTGLKRSRQQAWDMLASMGNEVLAGRPFADVARSRSEGPTAAAGGVFDWTNQGSLASKRLDEAIFSLPIDQLSAIIEEDTVLHIVRVIERTDAGRTPFLEAQVGIRESLHKDRLQRHQTEYLARLRERTPVWTIFDGKDGRPGQPTMTAGRPADKATR